MVEKVAHSECTAFIVAVPKRDGTYLICDDYKITVNSALTMDCYPLLKPDELFISLPNGQKFSNLDLLQAYQELLLEGESRSTLR